MKLSMSFIKLEHRDIKSLKKILCIILNVEENFTFVHGNK